MNDFDLPEGDREARIAKAIVEVIAEYTGAEPYGGGCRAFYTPAEWEARGEKYGHRSALIVCHDGGDAAKFFNVDYECYEAFEAMDKALRGIGFYAEACTSWYTAIYPTEGA